MFPCGIADEAGAGIEIQLRAHRELGWNAIEVRNVEGGNLTDVNDEHFEKVLAAVESAGSHIACFASQIANWSRSITSPLEKDLAELRRAIPRMQRSGTRLIRIMSYPNDADRPLPETKWRDEVVRRLKELARMAEEGGVVLAHENCSGWGGEGPAQSLEMLQRVGSEALKLIFDPGNAVTHGQDVWGYYQAVRDHVVHVHVKDAVREEGKSRFTYCGQGEGKIPQILADLAARDFPGAVSIEPHLAAIVHEGKTAGPEELYDCYLEYGRRLNGLIAQARAKRP